MTKTLKLLVLFSIADATTNKPLSTFNCCSLANFLACSQIYAALRVREKKDHAFCMISLILQTFTCHCIFSYSFHKFFCEILAKKHGKFKFRLMSHMVASCYEYIGSDFN